MELLKRFKYCEKVTRGMSADEKYKVTTADGRVLLLRVSKVEEQKEKEDDFHRMKELYKNGVPVPCPIEFGVTEDDKYVYSLTAWIEGPMVESVLGEKTSEEQYALGLRSGEILKKVHDLSSINMEENWYQRYLDVIRPRIDAFRNEGIPFDGDKEVLDFFEKNIALLKVRPQAMLHGDYHMGNMILSNGKDIVVIDWEKVDFDSIGDPWYEFNRIGTEYPEFAKGQIDGYFNGNPPEQFWKLFALYLSVSAITSIVWAKYFAKEELENIMALNRDVIRWFDHMKNPVPLWYRI